MDYRQIKSIEDLIKTAIKKVTPIELFDKTKLLKQRAITPLEEIAKNFQYGDADPVPFLNTYFLIEMPIYFQEQATEETFTKMIEDAFYHVTGPFVEEYDKYVNMEIDEVKREYPFILGGFFQSSYPHPLEDMDSHIEVSADGFSAHISYTIEYTFYITKVDMNELKKSMLKTKLSYETGIAKSMGHAMINTLTPQDQNVRVVYTFINGDYPGKQEVTVLPVTEVAGLAEGDIVTVNMDQSDPSNVKTSLILA